MHLDPLENVDRILYTQLSSCAQPTESLHSSFVELTKSLLDAVATKVTETQQDRQKSSNQSRKRKRKSTATPAESNDHLKIKKIHIEGLSTALIWQQAKRVLEAANDEIEHDIPDEQIMSQDDEVRQDQSEDESLGEEGVDYEVEALQEEGIDGEEDQLESSEEAEDEEQLDEANNGDDDDDNDSDADDVVEETLVKDKHGLNDGFFSIDQFNKQSEFLERQDANGDPDDGAASDEQDVEWTVDPLDQTFGLSDDGPTFGNVDLNAPEGDSEDEMGLDDANEEDDEDMIDPNITYKDFFAPPAVQSSKRKQKKFPPHRPKAPNNHDTKLATEEELGSDDELHRAMASAHRDLFDDQREPTPALDDNASDDLGPSQANLSNHERRQLALRAEIRRLESENVARKDWSLTGETVAPARPQNALLEEDLDFERAGKPINVPTAELTLSIEDLIKNRILKKEFDEVIRRRPTDLVAGTGQDARRGRLDLELTTQKRQGLADDYEADYLSKTDPNHVDSRSATLKTAHAEIQSLWSGVSAKLDALSNWHYKPRPPVPSLEVRTDAPVVALEDARPSGIGGEIGGGASQLAPQEVYTVGEAGRKGDKSVQLITKGGAVVAREEESRETKLRRRRREKERIRKASGNKQLNELGVNGQSNVIEGKPKNKKQERNEVAGQLKKGGVQIIGKKGQLTDVDGNTTIARSDRRDVGSLKL